MNISGFFPDDDSSHEDVLANILYDEDNDFELEMYRDNNQLLLDNLKLMITTVRPNYRVCDRIDWSAHVAELTEGSPIAFQRLYWMSIDSFNKLCHYLDPCLEVDST
jgi:hypothetical protein